MTVDGGTMVKAILWWVAASAILTPLIGAVLRQMRRDGMPAAQPPDARRPLLLSLGAATAVLVAAVAMDAETVGRGRREVGATAGRTDGERLLAAPGHQSGRSSDPARASSPGAVQRSDARSAGGGPAPGNGAALVGIPPAGAEQPAVGTTEADARPPAVVASTRARSAAARSADSAAPPPSADVRPTVPPPGRANDVAPVRTPPAQPTAAPTTAVSAHPAPPDPSPTAAPAPAAEASGRDRDVGRATEKRRTGSADAAAPAEEQATPVEPESEEHGSGEEHDMGPEDTDERRKSPRGSERSQSKKRAK